MSCETAGKNATLPAPAVAPGSEDIDPQAIAAHLGGGQWVWPGGAGPIDPRIPQLVPGFDAPFFQAGLAGYSDAAMRIIARRHGCPFCVTEALLDRTLLAGGRGFDKADLGDLHDNIPGGPEDHPLAGQIMGSDPREMAAAAVKMIEQRTRTDKAYRLLAYDGNPDAAMALAKARLRLPGGIQLAPFDPSIDAADVRGTALASTTSLCLSVSASLSFEVLDVNLACPVKKIERKARGGHWLAEPGGAIEILEAVREAVPGDVVCAVKMRRSFDDTPEMAENFERIFNAAYAIGYAWVTVHARTVEQKYVGPSRWDVLRDLRARHPDKLFFGSGDVWSVDDIFRMIAYTGVNAVAVARGCIGNPWIFRQARQMLAGEPPAPPTIAEQRAVLEDHFRLSLAVTRRFRHAEETTSRMMRKFAIRFAQHHPREQEVRRRFIAVTSTQEWMGVLDEFYKPSAVLGR